MSKLVTLQQAKKLKELGYDKVHCTCGGLPDCICTIENAVITIAEALDWFREIKGIHCSVMLRSYFDSSIRYTGRYLIDVYGGWVER